MAFLSSSQRRGNALPVLPLLLLSACHFFSLASCTIWTVGDSQGWNVNIDYSTWAAGKTFKVNDILFFPYAQGAHDVTVVSQSEYTACTSSANDPSYSSGNTNITLTAAGKSYYICSIPGHCGFGMKLTVDVSTAASTPVVSPTKAPSKAPSPPPVAFKTPSPSPTTTKAPSSTPASAPSSVPATAPSSSSTPASSPSSTPSSSPPTASSTPPASTPSTPPSSAPSLQGRTTLALLSIFLGTSLLAI